MLGDVKMGTLNEEQSKVVENKDAVETAAGNLNGNNKRKIYYLIGIVIAVLVAVIFYFCYWIKTPTYSLNLIRTAVEKHDSVKFEEHVDLNQLYGRAVDDLISANGADASNPLVAGMMQMFKQVAVPALSDATKRYVETGNFEKKEVPKNNQKIDPNEVADSMKDKTGVDTIEFKGVGNTKKDGKIAVVDIKVYDKQVKKDFIIQVKMRELDNGSWKVVEISNLKEYVQEHDKAVAEKLTELNKPVAEKIASVLELKDTPKASVISDGNPFFASYTLKFDYPILLKTITPITEYTIEVKLIDQSNNILWSGTGNVSGNFVGENKSFSMWNTWKLNQFIEKEANIIKQGVGDKKVVTKITRVKLSDGTEYKYLVKLPPVEK